jgi:hypothetical protein
MIMTISFQDVNQQVCHRMALQTWTAFWVRSIDEDRLFRS